MCVIVREMMNLYWIIGLLVLWSGVITSGNTTAAPGVGTTTSNETSAFIISIKITNHSYSDSLKDQNSQSYKDLRQDVEIVFSRIYSLTPEVRYQKITEMTFSNGSVIANSTVIFGTKQYSEEMVKQLFVDNYLQHHALLTLDLNINYTIDQETNLVQSQDGKENSATSPSTDDHSTTTHPGTYFTNHGSTFSHLTSHTTSGKSSTEAPSNTFNPSATSLSTTFPASSSATTVHPSSKISTVSASSPSTTTVRPSSKISTVSASSPSTTTVRPSSKISTVSASSPSTTTVRPSSNISTMSASSSSESVGKTVTQKPSGPEETHTVATEQGVPGWGIAILVLAAIILFFMLVLLILLLLFWCCWWKQRGFMNVSDPDPTGYYNPDIPMYSSHSTYDSHNGKSLESGSARPPKNWTGRYNVNK